MTRLAQMSTQTNSSSESSPSPVLCRCISEFWRSQLIYKANALTKKKKKTIKKSYINPILVVKKCFLLFFYCQVNSLYDFVRWNSVQFDHQKKNRFVSTEFSKISIVSNNWCARKSFENRVIKFNSSSQFLLAPNKIKQNTNSRDDFVLLIYILWNWKSVLEHTPTELTCIPSRTGKTRELVSSTSSSHIHSVSVPSSGALYT